MLSLLREHRFFFLGTTLAALALRLFFFFHFPAVTDDSHSYASFASNWLQHGVYGQTELGPQQTQVAPSDARLPGYPAFLAAMFWLFGAGNFKAAMLAQILFDLGACLIVADLARRTISRRAASIAFVLAALCPFLADYAAAALTETLEVFFTALALDCAAAALDRMDGAGFNWHWGKLWAATGAAIAACILLRPDGGILLAAVGLYLVVAATIRNCHPERTGAPSAPAFGAMGWGSEGSVVCWKSIKIRSVWGRASSPVRAERSSALSRAHRNPRSAIAAGLIVTLFSLAPLVPWTIRNFLAFHRFQPLAPRYANEPDEFVARGFNRWAKTWMAEYVSVEEIYWSVPGDKINPLKLPSRAMESAAERERTLAAIADYNETHDMTPELDARFGQLAADRIRARPWRYYVALPALRVADMWLRPRTEILPPDVRWWEFTDDLRLLATAIGLGLLNLAYVAAALLAVVFRPSRRPAGIRWAGLLLGFVLLRSSFLGTLENPEPRYTLECYPVVIVLASAWLARRFGQAE